MSDLKALRARIKSVTSTQKITKAMQLISATKFTKAKNQIHDSEYYTEILYNIMANVGYRNNLQDLSEENKKFFVENSSKTHLLLVVTSERGLCGGFNFMVTKRVKYDIINLENAGEQVKLIIIGKKGYDILQGQYSTYIDSYFEFPKSYDNNLSLQLKERVMMLATKSEIKNCQVYFNQYKNALVQIPTKKQILPVENQLKSQEESVIQYELEGEGLIANIVDLYVTSEINYALIQSRASEEGARMVAMDNATKNANNLIDKLTLKLNRSRQNLITNDLIEIIAGAEAI